MLYPPNQFPTVTSILVTLTLILAACTPVDEHWTHEYDRSAMPVSESWNVSFYVSETDIGLDDSRPRLHLEAGYMATFEDDSTYTVLQADVEDSDSAARVRATIYDKSTGDVAATVLADRIVYVDRDRQFEATGNVYVAAREERTLESEHLRWYERTRHVRAPGFVRIVSPRERIEGYNLDADEDLDNYRLERVTGEAQIDDEEPRAPAPPEGDSDLPIVEES